MGTDPSEFLLRLGGGHNLEIIPAIKKLIHIGIH